LREYVAVRDTGDAQYVASAIGRCGHPTVWAEMKAQSNVIGELRSLFGAAPEAFSW
jgi:hypothetical protein